MSGIKLGSNIASLGAQRRLAQSSEALSSTYERLSSGQRINSAADDAAGLAIASTLRANTRVYAQAIRNVNDGISTLNIADAALEQLASVSIRQRELATQAANGTYSTAQRNAMNTEANALVDEFNRIISTTSFNQRTLLDGSVSELRIQAGYGNDGGIAFNLGQKLARTTESGSPTAAADGTFAAAVSYSSATSSLDLQMGDINNDGRLDVVTVGGTLSVMLGNGNGSFAAPISSNPIALTVPWDAKIADVSGDSIADLVVASHNLGFMGVMVGNGNGTFKAMVSYANAGVAHGIAVGYFDNDSYIDVALTNRSNNTVNIFIGNGNGTFKARSSYATGATVEDVVTANFNGDSYTDLVTVDRGSSTVSVLLANSDGTFQARTAYTIGASSYFASVGDFNGDSLQDIATVSNTTGSVSVLLGNGNGTFKAQVTYTGLNGSYGISNADLNGDSARDLIVTDITGSTVEILLGNGNGTFKARTSMATSGGLPYSVVAGDISGDGVNELVTANYNTGINVYIGNGSSSYSSSATATIATLDLTSQSAARSALTTIDETIARISSERGSIGAVQSRFDVTLKNLAVARENFMAAESRISSADVASEAAQLVRMQILQQASVSALAQANQQPALAIKLLRGG